MSDLTAVETFKRAAALRALALVANDMVVGLGTGSTARWLVQELGEAMQRGELRGVRGVATSLQTEQQAAGLGIPLIELPEDGVDLCVDGMDELTPALDAIKGLGAALTREKIVAASAKTFVLIGDDSKHVEYLGQRAPVPVEVVRFGARRTANRLAALGGRPEQRLASGQPVITDNGNYIYDLYFSQAFDAAALANNLSNTPGVVEHGLFLGMAAMAFVASSVGVAEYVR